MQVETQQETAQFLNNESKPSSSETLRYGDGFDKTSTNSTFDLSSSANITLTANTEVSFDDNKNDISNPHSFLYKLTDNGRFTIDQIVQLLLLGYPHDVEQYSEHIFKILLIITEKKNFNNSQDKLIAKLLSLFESLDRFIDVANPLHSRLYLVIEKNFDLLIKMATENYNMTLSSHSIKFLTNVVYKLNYWEIYNLLIWKPTLYHFLNLVQFDLNDCYQKFLTDYNSYNYQQETILYNRDHVGHRVSLHSSDVMEGPDSNDEQEESIPVHLSDDYDDDSFINDDTTSIGNKRRGSIEPKFKFIRGMARRINSRLSNKSSNYDPDVVHECQLPSAEEPNKLCLRRFSRKYELIRHQETVHSKKKKLFKCFVCIKENPGIGPRIFTRHDTLAKHIRVNHKISGKDAKTEVAYSKKHAEIVEEGDITVRVGRRKTKVDFEMRAHMERKKIATRQGLTEEEFMEQEKALGIDFTALTAGLDDEELDDLDDFDNLDPLPDN